MKRWLKLSVVATATLVFSACGSTKTDSPKVGGTVAEAMPVFSLAASEYPSWSTFVVAKKAKLINGGDGGEPGSLEKKWGVRLKLEVKDYDPCLTMYAGGTVDAVCMTNMDALNPALGRASTVILPTSTSAGADKVITSAPHVVSELDRKPTKESVAVNLKGQKTYGLSKSVSEFVFVRCLETLGLDPKEYPFVNLDPAAAANAMQTGAKDVQTICVWNPFALQTLRTKKTAKVLFDSSMIPEEVIDCVVMANDSLNKPGGDKAAALICDVFYEVCKRIDNPQTADVALKALGEEFSNLPVDDMRLCCKETRFYSTPQSGMKLFADQTFQQKTMPKVVQTCKQIGVLEKDAPTVGFQDPSKQLNFDTQYMQKAASR